MIKTRRVNAGACLLELSQFMERFYSVNLRYDKDKSDTNVVLPGTQCQTDLNGYYKISIATTPAIAARSYTLQAVPQGTQSTKDPKTCGTLTINQTGQKGAAGGTTKVPDCW
ncbi:MAG: pilus assembly protein PilE [Azoarcus sp.]|nr:pilus assembly protein PilE [Azoarcus sp.]